MQDKVEIEDLILKSRHVDPNYAELQNYIDNFYESIIKRMIEETDNYIMSQFARFGLSRDEVLSLVREGTIWTSHGACWTRYWLDDEPLFDIVLTDFADMYKSVLVN